MNHIDIIKIKIDFLQRCRV